MERGEEREMTNRGRGKRNGKRVAERNDGRRENGRERKGKEIRRKRNRKRKKVDKGMVDRGRRLRGEEEIAKSNSREGQGNGRERKECIGRVIDGREGKL